jgi:7-carboxy-7-deazaguanine synthase
LVEVTGGEPLLQKDVFPLMERLIESGRTVLLETGGSLDIGPVNPQVIKIVDLKMPQQRRKQAQSL